MGPCECSLDWINYENYNLFIFCCELSGLSEFGLGVNMVNSDIIDC